MEQFCGCPGVGNDVERRLSPQSRNRHGYFQRHSGTECLQHGFQHRVDLGHKWPDPSPTDRFPEYPGSGCRNHDPYRAQQFIGFDQSAGPARVDGHRVAHLSRGKRNDAPLHEAAAPGRLFCLRLQFDHQWRRRSQVGAPSIQQSFRADDHELSGRAGWQFGECFYHQSGRHGHDDRARNAQYPGVDEFPGDLGPYAGGGRCVRSA